MNQSTSIIEIKGIGEKTAALFQKLNIKRGGGGHGRRDGGGTRQGEKDTRCETHEKHAGHGDDHRHG